MEREKKYPRTGNYRTHRNQIEEHALKSDESLTAIDYHRLFGFEGAAYQKLTQSEREDIDNFVEYGTNHLAAGAAISELGRIFSKEHSLSRSLDRLSPTSSVAHDLIHGMLAYGRTGGRSFMPAYMNVESEQDQETDAVAIQEEMIVDLLDGGGTTFVKKLFSDESWELPKMVINNIDRAKMYETLVDKIQPLKDSNRPEYFFGVYEAYYRARWRPKKDEELAWKFDAAMDFIEKHRDPEYVRIFTDKFNLMESGTKNPRFGFEVFQRIMKPLLERLRNQPKEDKVIAA